MRRRKFVRFCCYSSAILTHMARLQKPILVDASTQTDSREADENQKKATILQSLNLSLQENMAKREHELLTKIAELSTENNRLRSEAQILKERLALNANGNEDVQMTVAPQETYSPLG
ncbi:hypothetical protein BDY19DRAFT_252499 [Irpex rosettiformis]|uniref:Uncharacterized protein n=1 Tax=Irpex rosettiformis TaxID=378272 RepID=A0ACB8TZF4_9APHY|nr:hypothetical protein BDY19DRAFT_252499 [Irpex rosettiformis]